MQAILALILLSNSVEAHAGLNNEFSHSLLIRSTLDSNHTEAFCSGVALTSKVVLTTAHCIVGNSNHAVRISDGKKTKWVKPISKSRSSNYEFSASPSNSDIGILEFKEELPYSPLSICLRTHANEIITQVGTGLRNGKHDPTPIYFKADALKDGDLVQEAPDALAVMGDSGAPIFALESGTFCLYAIHSSVTSISSLKPNDLQKSFNPIVRRTSLPLELY